MTPSTFATAELDAFSTGSPKETDSLASTHALAVGDGLTFFGSVAGTTPPVRCTPSLPGAAFGLSRTDKLYPSGVVGFHTQHMGVAFTSVTIYSR